MMIEFVVFTLACISFGASVGILVWEHRPGARKPQ